MSAPIDIYGGRDPRDVPAYTAAAAAALVQVPKTTLHQWIAGRRYSTRGGSRRAGPVIKLPDASGFLSFTNVIEAHVLAALRRHHGVKLPNIRAAVRYVEGELARPHPLATEGFRTDGVDLFVERLGELINASKHGQLAMRALIGSSLERIEYEKGRALRFFPITRPSEDAPRLIVVDPRRAFGRPALAATGIPVASIADRFQGGDSVELLVEDFGVSTEAVQEALRFARAAA